MRICFWQEYNADWIGARQAGRQEVWDSTERPRQRIHNNNRIKGYMVCTGPRQWSAAAPVKRTSNGKNWMDYIMVVSFGGGMQCQWWHCPIDCMFITVSQLKPRRVCGGGVHWHNGFSIKNRFITRILVFWPPTAPGLLLSGWAPWK